jgi:hypothetical protein
MPSRFALCNSHIIIQPDVPDFGGGSSLLAIIPVTISRVLPTEARGELK